MFMYVAIRHTDLNDIHKNTRHYIAPSVTLVYLFGVSLILYGTAAPKSQVAVSTGTFSLSMPKVLITTTSKNKKVRPLNSSYERRKYLNILTCNPLQLFIIHYLNRTNNQIPASSLSTFKMLWMDWIENSADPNWKVTIQTMCSNWGAIDSSHKMSHRFWRTKRGWRASGWAISATEPAAKNVYTDCSVWLNQ